MGIEQFRQLGGARVGDSFGASANFTFPFARLRATPNCIVLSVWWGWLVRRLWGLAKTYEFDKASIVEISKYKGLISTGLRISYSQKDYPPFVVFWTFRFRRLKRELERLGYTVKE
jgi:hypothetical protein